MSEKIKKILENHERRISALERLLLKGKVEENLKEIPKRVEIGLEKNMGKLAKSAGIEIDQVKQIYDFEKEDLTLLVEAGGEDVGEKQLRATLVILVGLSYCYEKEEILSGVLGKKLKTLGISLANLARNLDEHPRFVLPVGKPKSTKFQYKITVPGKNEGLKIVRELVVG